MDFNDLKGKVRVKAAYHKAPMRQPDYIKCPGCCTTKYVNYIAQVQRGMRSYSCAKCKLIILSWGPALKKPRPRRDAYGRVFRYTDEMGEGND